MNLEVTTTDRALHRLSVEEFLIDLIGGLVPGMLFIAAIGLLAFPVLHITLREYERAGTDQLLKTFLDVLEKSQNTPSAIWLAALLMVFILAFTIGHLFSRRDPNAADLASFRRLTRGKVRADALLEARTKTKAALPRTAWQRFKIEHKADLNLKEFWIWWRRPWSAKVVANNEDLVEKLRESFGCCNDEECQFPYQSYDRYLNSRGMDLLVPFAEQWTKVPGHRSKNHLNRIKIHLRLAYPERCASIIRNEAHIRLAASTWYVCGSLLTTASISLLWVIALHANGAHPWLTKEEGPWSLAVVGPYVTPVLACLAVALFCWRARRSISAYFHYQRMREILFVLETAWGCGFAPNLTNARKLVAASRPRDPHDIFVGGSSEPDVDV